MQGRGVGRVPVSALWARSDVLSRASPLSAPGRRQAIDICGSALAMLWVVHSRSHWVLVRPLYRCGRLFARARPDRAFGLDPGSGGIIKPSSEDGRLAVGFSCVVGTGGARRVVPSWYDGGLQ